MQRRAFLQLSSAALGAEWKLLAEAPMPMVTLGKSGLRVSKMAVGGFHASRNSIETAVEIIQRAIDLGVNFLDSAHLYNNGRSDEAYGKALTGGRRQKVILMSKAHLRTEQAAMRQLEETLKRMQTDYLDLWQCHQVSTMEEVAQILGPGGALEAFVKAKQQGKVRHIGFTGHHDPAVHLRLLDGYDGWETIQHPVNLIDPHYLSFIRTVLPKAKEKNLGRIGMKSNGIGAITRNGIGAITRNGIATIQECLRFAWSQDIDALVSGVETVEQLNQNVLECKTFQKMSAEEISQLLARTAKGPYGTKIERYKKPEA